MTEIVVDNHGFRVTYKNKVSPPFEFIIDAIRYAARMKIVYRNETETDNLIKWD